MRHQGRSYLAAKHQKPIGSCQKMPKLAKPIWAVLPPKKDSPTARHEVQPKNIGKKEKEKKK
jgi:hypothetical protein